MTLPDEVVSLVRSALAEDVGPGDWTTLWTVPAEARAEGRIFARAEGIVAGTEVAREVFRQVDPLVEVEVVRKDGSPVRPGDEVVRLSGSARSLLSAERVALNFMQRLSGVATLTRRFVEAVDGTGARVLDTRKTTPGMRSLEKAAVRTGGGVNHRSGLHDMVLVKENHVEAAGGIGAAVERIRALNSAGLEVEVEVRSQRELEEALGAGVSRILLDNMTPDELRGCVERVRRLEGQGPLLEASGGITLEGVRTVAETGVDFVSVGALTHSVPALDLSMLLTRR
jgi:nicotinate-nucleotide pyrophosphorylase (carboxylating)